ncbi:NADAR family protein [Sphingobacterium sp. SRCM116780]|uniref:NADAR family protein n=1 Tax=Sphingobacterium sp. SRCM116780 TaxID=2907623 RepID=UPI001F18DCAB|nr:NADAR family protein [Sphingobacterium sp. SRCM116780]UIR56396.1 NADAR family protein [Sphingobacterium sp. SRCM116780]
MKNKFTINRPMPPLWLMYPHISQFSIGWRMGYGESYRNNLFDWLETLTDDENKKYQEMFPAPKTWREYYNIDYDFEDVEEFECEHVQLWNKGGEMEYSRNKLIGQFETEKPTYIFFWKPNIGIVDKSCLGQWQPSIFKVDADTYCCTEQYMMAEKARLFEDEEIAGLIMKSTDPKEMKALGKKVKNFDQTIWDRVKYSIVLNGNYFKFSQNKGIRQYLLATENKILVETSPLDTIWGIGLSENNGKVLNPNTWRDKNLLGFALMEVRDELRKLYKNYDRIDWQKLEEYD